MMNLKKEEKKNWLVEMTAFTPKSRKREISKALKAYASMVSSADTGAVRMIE